MVADRNCLFPVSASVAVAAVTTAATAKRVRRGHVCRFSAAVVACFVVVVVVDSRSVDGRCEVLRRRPVAAAGNDDVRDIRYDRNDGAAAAAPVVVLATPLPSAVSLVDRLNRSATIRCHCLDARAGGDGVA
jgi:hypothetical protein